MNQLRPTICDVLILGGGAAGLMCAIEAGKRGRSVVLLERNRVVGEKIRISGGGRCNFTNINASAANFISANPHFCKSALAQYTPKDFIRLVEQHQISYHEKKLGQLFCDQSSQQIIDMLLGQCEYTNIRVETDCSIISVQRSDRFVVRTSKGEFESASLVVATGGKSIPKLGATSLGYEIARQFGLSIVSAKPGLVPFTFSPADLKTFGPLAGVSLDARVMCNAGSFRENLLFTHRGLSGPAILQVSSYWNPGDAISIDLLPDEEGEKFLDSGRTSEKDLSSYLGLRYPQRFVDRWLSPALIKTPMHQLSKVAAKTLAGLLKRWELTPAGTEGFGKAEVTVGGVNTDELSSKTMECTKVPGLYIIGEVVDVTGWLGGYNFQWAWSSGAVAGRNV